LGADVKRDTIRPHERLSFGPGIYELDPEDHYAAVEQVQSVRARVLLPLMLAILAVLLIVAALHVWAEPETCRPKELK
jgi:hypothetical protein